MTSHYAANHLQADWAADAQASYARKLAAREAEARKTIDLVTRDALVEYTRTIADIEPSNGSPRWVRARDAAKRKYEITSKAALALYPRCVAELMATGEISEELDAELTAIRDASRAQMQQAAE